KGCAVQQSLNPFCIEVMLARHLESEFFEFCRLPLGVGACLCGQDEREQGQNKESGNELHDRLSR
ncbi:MAG: hypothetical protein AB2653_10065, partial [Candidatus Thiodiazotropha endolucinida]